MSLSLKPLSSSKLQIPVYLPGVVRHAKPLFMGPQTEFSNKIAVFDLQQPHYPNLSDSTNQISPSICIEISSKDIYLHRSFPSFTTVEKALRIPDRPDRSSQSSLPDCSIPFDPHFLTVRHLSRQSPIPHATMPSIYDFDRQKESDISKVVPKLKGEFNFAQWQHRLYMALKENNKIYIEIIQGIAQQPIFPDLYDESIEAVREFAQHRAASSSSGDPNAPVSDAVVRELVKEQKHKNMEILERHQVLLDKWDLVNTRCCNLIFSTLDTIPASHIQNVEDAREAVELLRAEYGLSSWQGNFKRFEVLDNIQYKNNNPQEFVRRFKKALFELQQRDTVLPANMVLNFFVKAVQGNPRCQLFIQDLAPDLKDPNFMANVYHDFTMTEGFSQLHL